MICIETVQLTPNPVLTGAQLKIEVGLYALYPAEALYPSAELYPGEALFVLYPQEDLYPDMELYPAEGGI